MTSEVLDQELTKYKRIGTFMLPLTNFSRIEQKDYRVQMRRLRGEHYGLYFREQNKLQTLRSLKPGESRELTEQEQIELHKSIESMRRLLVASINRIFECDTDVVTIFKPTEKAPGDHEVDQISIDLLEPDYIDLIHQLLVKSGLIAEVTSTEAPFPGSGHDDTGAAGSGGEEVRPTPEPVSEGVAAGSAL